jgi:transcriptional regulator with XRE-family HTH domain
MKGGDDAKDFGLVVALLCALRRWNQAKLVEESGIDKDSISDYLYGVKSASRKNRERIATAFGVTYPFLERLVPILRGLRVAYEIAAGGGEPSAAAGEDALKLEQAVTGAFMEGMAPILLQLDQLDGAPAARARDREWAAARWASLERMPALEQSKLVAVLQGDERCWALAARISEASAEAGAHDLAEARRLEELAASLVASLQRGMAGN